jgi:hypothetical protein
LLNQQHFVPVPGLSSPCQSATHLLFQSDLALNQCVIHNSIKKEALFLVSINVLESFLHVPHFA